MTFSEWQQLAYNDANLDFASSCPGLTPSIQASPASSFRDGAQAPDPESRDSGFDATHRPGM